MRAAAQEYTVTNILPFNFGSSKQTRAAIHDDLVCVPEITTAVAFHWVEGGTEHFYASKDGTDDMSAIAHTVELTECRFERIELPEDHRDHLYSVTAQCSIDGVAGEMVFVARVSYDQRITALGAQYSPTHALRLLFASFGGWVRQEACRIQECRRGSRHVCHAGRDCQEDEEHRAEPRVSIAAPGADCRVHQ